MPTCCKCSGATYGPAVDPCPIGISSPCSPARPCSATQGAKPWRRPSQARGQQGASRTPLGTCGAAILPSVGAVAVSGASPRQIWSTPIWPYADHLRAPRRSSPRWCPHLQNCRANCRRITAPILAELPRGFCTFEPSPMDDRRPQVRQMLAP